MKFAVLVYEGPYNHEASDSAYNFINAALEKGHECRGIFFYHDGVYNVTKLMEPPQDDRHIANRWSELGAKGIDIVVCIAAAKRRGIVDDVLVDNVRISGLGQLTMMAIEADKMVVFGD
ncbi:sulfurtransferase complex subunit TusD [Magnetococcus sp. PR-3]|uniref:sulfurtransferase complex subunit TusD n=1 Tax=Magnetococcus sp. PR-3 TaxID=3120355 RepID=UPI002FCE21B3